MADSSNFNVTAIAKIIQLVRSGKVAKIKLTNKEKHNGVVCKFDGTAVWLDCEQKEIPAELLESVSEWTGEEWNGPEWNKLIGRPIELTYYEGTLRTVNAVLCELDKNVVTVISDTGIMEIKTYTVQKLREASQGDFTEDIIDRTVEIIEGNYSR